MHRPDEIRWIGCASWNLRKEHADEFPAEGSHLDRYADVFSAVEINSSFYRPHRRSTYERWAKTTPNGFRFAVKMPRQITHEHRLANAGALIEPFVDQIEGLGDKLGPILIQLPPSLKFSPRQCESFFRSLRTQCTGPLVCEPRHASWFEAEAENLLSAFRVGRVAADPAVVPAAAVPGGWCGTAYYRWHGSPRVYYSSYTPETLAYLAIQLAEAAIQGEAWCIFDNTAEGAALQNALALQNMCPHAALLRQPSNRGSAPRSSPRNTQ